MKSLLILGAGAYGRLVQELAENLGYDQIDFLDDNQPTAIGKLKDLQRLQGLYDHTIVAIGNSAVRNTYFNQLISPATLIHPSAVVSKSAKIGKGVIIEAMSVIQSESVIDDGTFICAGAVVNHSSRIGRYCQIDCNAVVASYASVPDHTIVSYCQTWH